MKRTFAALAACLPLAALAGPMGPGPGPDGEGWEARKAQMVKRIRVAFAVGYAEALDLGEAEALKAREVLARFSDRRAALGKQLQEQVQVVRKAAQGDAAAGKALDGALARLRELRGQMTALHDEMFQALTQGLSPERKAKAAIFMKRFRTRMMAGMGHLRERIEMRHRMPGGMGPGPGMDRGPGGMGGPGWPRMGTMQGGEPGDGGPDAEFFIDDEG